MCEGALEVEEEGPVGGTATAADVAAAVAAANAAAARGSAEVAAIVASRGDDGAGPAAA